MQYLLYVTRNFICTSMHDHKLATMILCAKGYFMPLEKEKGLKSKTTRLPNFDNWPPSSIKSGY